ncbi:glycoside hydrolase family 97 catalytic domain-containing protein [Mesoflavibacter sp. CH_XMU1404-2]|uniref:glycoside hydrolase family 97 protein n=1 Tax=Mesoflavibacter sp. CH_XMU1404-2 TaxID=3107766 RepID=UPI003009CACD
MKNLLLTTILLAFTLFGCKQTKQNHVFENKDKTISLTFNLDKNQRPFYTISHKNNTILDTSYLGIDRNDSNFYSNLSVLNVSEAKTITDQYSLFHGKQKEIIYEAQQYTISLKNEDNKKLNIIFNLSDDGVAFRYEFPETSDSIFKIKDEKTTFNFNKNTKSFLQPMSKAKTGWEHTNPSYEEHYDMEIPVNKPSSIKEGWVFPALFNTNQTWIAITETGLNSNYCGSRLQYNNTDEALKITFPQKEEIFTDSALNPESKTPWLTPWRVIAIGDLKTITESTLGTDLADKAINMDTSFIKSGLASWSWALLKDDSVNYDTTKQFIDYASTMHWSYCLIDVNWDTTIGNEKMKALADYAKTKDVKLIVWYNSSGDWNTTPYHPKSKLLTHEDRVREFKRMNDLGISGVKIDFFGGDGQSMIAYYHNILKDAADYKLLVNFHGATLPRGWHRTYPHLMTVEAIKGQEFITFFQDIADLQPSHCATLPFTRNLFDPMDFTPMVLDSIPGIERKTTKTFELALPVLFLSGIQHIAETPTGMYKQPDFILDYLKEIPTNWDQSKFITGYPSKDVIIARRQENTWFIVGINGENKPKELQLDLSFIKDKDGYIITDKNETFDKSMINSKNLTTIKLQPNGGFVAKF